MTLSTVFRCIGRAPLSGLLTAGLLAALLAGCTTNPDRLPLGMGEGQVLQASGRPTSRTALPGGGERLVYSRQPAGQQVYQVDLDAQGRVVRREQVLDEAFFAKVALDRWTREDILQSFGPPAEQSRVYAFKGDVWTYRYVQNGIDRQWHVHIDPQGVVRQAYSTDEPRHTDDFMIW